MLKAITENGEMVNVKASSNGELLVKMTGGVDTSDATATDNDIISGQTAYVKGEKIVGNMANNGEINITPSLSEQNIPAGYTTGGTISAVTADIDGNILAENIKKDVTILGVTGSLDANTGLDTSDATATESDIVVGKTAYVNGSKIEGIINECVSGSSSFVSFEDNTPYPTFEIFEEAPFIKLKFNNDELFRNGSYIDLNGNQELATAIGLTADKIKAGETILGVTGTYTGEA